MKLNNQNILTFVKKSTLEFNYLKVLYAKSRINLISKINFSNLPEVSNRILDGFPHFFLKRKLLIFVKDAAFCKSQSQ